MPRDAQLTLLSVACLTVLAFARLTTPADERPHDSRSLTPAALSSSVDSNLSAAVCPVVYQLDDAPGTRGYRYTFYGNAFFINREGYLLTAAHVLTEFRNGGQASILVRLAFAPPRLVKIEVIATDLDHDVAILRATPNPFRGPYSVATLPLGEKRPAIGEGVETTALRPGHLRDPHTFEMPIADSYPATVLNYRSIALNPISQASVPPVATPSNDLAAQTIPRSLGQRQIQTDLFLFSHEVQLGQSGAPVTSLANNQVVGIIEGRWLHPAASTLATPAKNSVLSNAAPHSIALTQGAAIPIPYAIILLQKSHVHWDAAPVKAIQPTSQTP